MNNMNDAFRSRQQGPNFYHHQKVGERKKFKDAMASPLDNRSLQQTNGVLQFNAKPQVDTIPQAGTTMATPTSSGLTSYPNTNPRGRPASRSVSLSRSSDSGPPRRRNMTNGSPDSFPAILKEQPSFLGNKTGGPLAMRRHIRSRIRESSGHPTKDECKNG